ncbi:MAG: hypothetical protein EOO60_04525 [Hymenobacter sp.]|nr:MAG: hypothetical protein EOO60_04525 [Hymenobacter sp.]
MNEEAAPRLKDTLYLFGDGLEGPGKDNMFYNTIHGDWYKLRAGFSGWPRALHGINTLYNDDWKNDELSKFLQATIAHCVAQQCDLIVLNVDSWLKELLLQKWGFQLLPNSSHIVRPCP